MKHNIIEIYEPIVEPVKEEPTIEFKASMNEAFIEALGELFNEAERNQEEFLEAAQEEKDVIEQQKLNQIWGHIGPRIP